MNRYSSFKRPVDDNGKPKQWSSFKAPERGAKPKLARSWMKRRPTRVKAGEEPEFLAFLRLMPCVVNGTKCRNSDPHHPIDCEGERRKGTGQRAPDRFAFSLCREHHEQFHHGTGFCKGWTKEHRRDWQVQENERQLAIYLEFKETGVLVEPVRETA